MGERVDAIIGVVVLGWMAGSLRLYAGLLVDSQLVPMEGLKAGEKVGRVAGDMGVDL